MSVEKNMNTRIQHKHDTEANWNKALNFIPKIGEIIIYDIDENYNYSRFKIGDGIRTINNLEFSQADLAGYATEEYVNNTIPTKTSQLTNDSGFISNDDILDTNGTLKNNVLPEGYPYKEIGEVLPETVIQIDPESGQGVILDEFELHIGNSYIVNYNGIEYTCGAKVCLIDNVDLVALGNVGVIDENSEIAESTDEPFLLLNFPPNIAVAMGMSGFITPLDGSEELSIAIYGNIINKISNEFLPNISNLNNIIDGSQVGSVRTILTSNVIGLAAHAEGYSTTASGNYSHAEGFSNQNAFDFITEESTNEEIIAAWNESQFALASGAGSHAEGSDTLALGDYSHTEGDGTVASGYCSHAEGDGTVASGYCSHAEGSDTLALGDYSHAEGQFTTASGYASHVEGNSANNAFDFITEESTNEEIIAAWNNNKFALASGAGSHAEGSDTLALGDYSHTEGFSATASGYASHAEGRKTIASGSYSHAEGGNTIASGNCQHVQGKYNIVDSNNQYAHIIGNGSFDSDRSNAHTLDWDGNAWFAGDVYIGGTGQNDSAAVKLAKMSDIPSTEGFATETYVNMQVANLVNTAPEALNTLNELAAALGDDPNFATTIAAEIGKKVDKVNGKGLSTNDFTDEYKDKLDQYNPDSVIIEETDPTVPAWAKSPTKPTYAKSEIGLGNVDNVKQYSANNPPVVAQSGAPTDTNVVWVDLDDETLDIDTSLIVQDVIRALGGTPVFGVVNSDKNIILSGNLEEGVYTLKYECSDGTILEIGTLNNVTTPEVTYTNLFIPDKASLNTRMSGTTSAPKAQDGYVMSAIITIPATDIGHNVDLSGKFIVVPAAYWNGSANVFYGRDGSTFGYIDSGVTKGTVVGDWVKLPIMSQWGYGSNPVVTEVTVSLYIKASAITASDIQDIEIYFNEIPE